MRYNKMLKTRFKFYLSTYCHLHSVFRFRSDFKNPSWRTHTCGELNSSHAGQEVTLCGWKSFLRCDQFIILRDSYGTTQIICKENENFTKKYLHSLPLESVIQVKGIVQKRPKKDVNKKLPTGEIEVEAIDVKLLNSSAVKTPIISKDHDKLTDNMKYRYRYLYLRNFKMQENLRTRSQILKKMWDFLQDKHGFVHVETPTLFKRTPGGAKEFVVPTIFPGKFYALPQSPQQFKQLLMVGGLDRYFQIARCYRNEGTKADRQPEFTQIDIELSFTTVDHILSLVESLLIFSWPENKDTLKVPFPRLTYKEAMELYGSDKPDLRFEIKLEDLTEEFKDSNLHFADKSYSDPDHIVSCILLPHGSKLIKKSLLKELQSLAESQNVAFVSISVKDDHSWASSISKHINEDVKKKTDNRLLTTPGDLIILASGKSKLTRLFLGKARVKCAEYLHSTGLNIIKPNISSFAWITDFPLFLDDENGNFESAHHPFTAPHPDDIDLIYTEPYQVRSQHYDLVLNGQEVGGGSIRVHDASLQKYILEDVLKENSSDLHHLLEALSYGCPPHGGIALGIDRILAIICGCQSITDVIAFPKSLDGKDLMSGAPCEISYEEKLMYHIEPTLIDLSEK